MRVDGPPLQRRIGAAAVAVAALVCLGSAHAQHVYRCSTNGKVTYTDTPCFPASSAGQMQLGRPDGTVPLSPPIAVVPAAPAVAPTAPADFYGGWTGEAQYQATVKSQLVDAAHAVVDFVMTVDPNGKLLGASKTNGCQALGIASPSNPQMLTLDVTLSGCTYAGYNRRYTGTFALPPGQGYARFHLLAYESRPGIPSAMYDITATMRR